MVEIDWASLQSSKDYYFEPWPHPFFAGESGPESERVLCHARSGVVRPARGCDVRGGTSFRSEQARRVMICVQTGPVLAPSLSLQALLGPTGHGRKLRFQHPLWGA